MHCRLVKEILTRNITSLPSRKKSLFKVPFFNTLLLKSIELRLPFILESKNLFRTMACCGSNGCGVDFSKEALKKKLTSIQYQVTQESDTERAFTGKYCNHFEKGVYNCVVCSQDLFSSEAKFESKCGWPAFFDVVDNQNVKLKNDLSHVSCNLLLLTMQPDLKRTEVSCSKCGAHLGHVFDDGPKPTGKRYCINSASLDFRKIEETPESHSS